MSLVSKGGMWLVHTVHASSVDCAWMFARYRGRRDLQREKSFAEEEKILRGRRDSQRKEIFADAP